MPIPQRDYRQERSYGYYSSVRRPEVVPIKRTKPLTQPIHRTKTRKTQKKRTNPIAQLFALGFAIVLGLYVLPFGYQRITAPLLAGGTPYKEVHVDARDLLHPINNYLANDLFLGERSFAKAETEKPEMNMLYPTDNMPVLEAKLNKLMKSYPSIDPAIYVWEYDSGKYVNIKGDKTYAAASIIKIPVLINLFKSIETNQLTIYDEVEMTYPTQASGSGNLQGQPLGSLYTVDQLARVMITDSDNSATNMIMQQTGSMNDVNQGLRRWGIQHTQLHNWLPDLDGTNYTTAKDMATMLYNLDNPSFLNINSRESIIDYMSHVKNNRLIQAGLPHDALFIHKTGDIGKMLGDAGIVFPSNGKKYIVVILANRPYNSPAGKDFIQQASKLIYQEVTTAKY